MKQKIQQFAKRFAIIKVNKKVHLYNDHSTECEFHEIKFLGIKLYIFKNELNW